MTLAQFDIDRASELFQAIVCCKGRISLCRAVGTDYTREGRILTSNFTVQLIGCGEDRGGLAGVPTPPLCGSLEM
jgi:hypothetical protein